MISQAKHEDEDERRWEKRQWGLRRNWRRDIKEIKGQRNGKQEETEKAEKEEIEEEHTESENPQRSAAIWLGLWLPYFWNSCVDSALKVVRSSASFWTSASLSACVWFQLFAFLFFRRASFFVFIFSVACSSSSKPQCVSSLSFSSSSSSLPLLLVLGLLFKRRMTETNDSTRFQPQLSLHLSCFFVFVLFVSQEVPQRACCRCSRRFGARSLFSWQEEQWAVPRSWRFQISLLRLLSLLCDCSLSSCCCLLGDAKHLKYDTDFVLAVLNAGLWWIKHSCLFRLEPFWFRSFDLRWKLWCHKPLCKRNGCSIGAERLEETLLLVVQWWRGVILSWVSSTCWVALLWDL